MSLEMTLFQIFIYQLTIGKFINLERRRNLNLNVMETQSARITHVSPRPPPTPHPSSVLLSYSPADRLRLLFFSTRSDLISLSLVQFICIFSFKSISRVVKSYSERKSLLPAWHALVTVSDYTLQILLTFRKLISCR